MRRYRMDIVAPRVGAWIETNRYQLNDIKQNQSHPVWVRGLKPIGNISQSTSDNTSHPVWVRGLKLHCRFRLNHRLNVAPRVGAWIETFHLWGIAQGQVVSHPVWVRGLKPLKT